MRLFVALDIDSDIRQRIGEFRDRMRPYGPDVRWVAPESFHITLQFIGETEKADDIRIALSQVRQAAVPLAFRGTGFFPNAKAPRIFWVGIESDQRLQNLAASVADILRPLGLKAETSAYKPHLTLARAGSGRPRIARGKPGSAGLRVVEIKLEGVTSEDFGSMTAREFCLYESKTSPSGAKYTKLKTYPLD